MSRAVAHVRWRRRGDGDAAATATPRRRRGASGGEEDARNGSGETGPRQETTQVTTRFDAPGTAVRLRDVAVLYLLSAIVRHAYHEYLEWAFFAFPEKRTQRDAVERTGRDVTGRTDDELELIEWHDRLTALSTFALLVGCYVFAGARLYPAVAVPEAYAEYFAARLR